MITLLEKTLPREQFIALWSDEAPSYKKAIIKISEYLIDQGIEHVSSFDLEITLLEPPRFKVSGVVDTTNQTKKLSLELVWLPNLDCYRIGYSFLTTPSPPVSQKTVQQVIEALDSASCDDKHLTIEGQVFEALEGFDEDSEGSHLIVPAIIRFFERFPDHEDQSLIHIAWDAKLESAVILDSLRRSPNISMICIVEGIINTTEDDSIKVFWTEQLRTILKDCSDEDIIEYASDLIGDTLN
ncbi:hypothetical protein ACFPK9_16000 [Rubritalea spongiae]|uniref:Uncharacterized protein n=1 Tax=Rubritalea spongiae TaxID=430797 RepID=A0ABW5E1Y9_9BACT